MRLSTLDLISAVMDRSVRPLEFAIILHLRSVPSRDGLAAGAASARLQFPSTGAVLNGKTWRITADPCESLQYREVERGQLQQVVRAYLDARLDPRDSWPVQQLVITSPDCSGAVLVTRVHHAAADGIAATLWLQHQLEVMWQLRPPVRFAVLHGHPQLRQHPKAKRTSAFAFGHPSHHLRDNGERASAQRRWLSIVLASGSLHTDVDRAGGFTYNDLLVTSAMESFRLWNEREMSGHTPAVGVWLPVNIRVDPLREFGNGSSRIRVYNRYAPDASLRDKCRSVRSQVAWSREHGEWAVPSHPGLHRLPMSVLRLALRAYFNRPWVDMGTGVFTHLQRSALDHLPPGEVTSAEIIGMLDVHHPLGFFALSLGGVTRVTCVYDPAQLSDADAGAIEGLLRAQLALAARELSP